MRRPRNVGSMTPSRRVLCLQCWARFFRRRRICLVCLGSFLDLFLFPICSLFLFATVALCPSSAALLFTGQRCAHGLRTSDMNAYRKSGRRGSGRPCVGTTATYVRPPAGTKLGAGGAKTWRHLLRRYVPKCHRIWLLSMIARMNYH